MGEGKGGERERVGGHLKEPAGSGGVGGTWCLVRAGKGLGSGEERSKERFEGQVQGKVERDAKGRRVAAGGRGRITSCRIRFTGSLRTEAINAVMSCPPSVLVCPSTESNGMPFSSLGTSPT